MTQHNSNRNSIRNIETGGQRKSIVRQSLITELISNPNTAKQNFLGIISNIQQPSPRFLSITDYPNSNDMVPSKAKQAKINNPNFRTTAMKQQQLVQQRYSKYDKSGGNFCNNNKTKMTDSFLDGNYSIEFDNQAPDNNKNLTTNKRIESIINSVPNDLKGLTTPVIEKY